MILGHLVFGLAVMVAAAVGDASEVDTAAKDALGELPGEAGFVFTEITDDGPVALFDVSLDEQFAIGSSFKLFIFGRLIEEVNAGRRRLDDTMLLRRDKTGPPHSEMAEWPVGSPVTLNTLALKMISVSDNTATDHLHYLLGRRNIERQMKAMGHSDPGVNRPLLSTREMTMLRDKRDGMPGRKYQNLDEAAKRKFLAKRSRATPNYEDLDFDTAAYSLAEWYASPLDMAQAMTWIYRHTMPDKPAHPMRAILTVDPKLPYDEEIWKFVGFKGGSEDQLLAGNWLMQHKNGKWYTFHVFCNSPEKPVTPDEMLGSIQKILTAIEHSLATTGNGSAE